MSKKDAGSARGGGSRRHLTHLEDDPQGDEPVDESILTVGTGGRNSARPPNITTSLAPPTTDTLERRERDTSPSALSQASSAILEWDPSADVGAALNVSVNEDDRQTSTSAGANRRQQGLSILNSVALSLMSNQSGGENLDKQQEPATPTTSTSTASNSHVRKQMVRSRSQEEEDLIEHPQHFGSVRSISMIELGSTAPGQKPLVIPQIRTVKNQERRDTSSRDSITTILSSRKVISDNIEPDQSLGRPYSTPSGTPPSNVTPDHSPILSPAHSNIAVGTSYSQPNRRHHRHNKRRKEYDRHESSDPENADHHRTFGRGVSEASTDWEYGHSRLHSHENDASSVSEWQTTGLTKSELEYQKKREEDEIMSSGTYSVRVELEANSRAKNYGSNLDVQTKTRSQSEAANFQASKSVQTQQPGIPKNKPRPIVDSSHTSRSNQTQARMFNLSGGRQQNGDVVRSKIYINRPKHHAVTKLRQHYVSSDMDMDTDLDHVVSKTSSSDLSPSCQRIQDLIRDETPVKDKGLLEEIELHRNLHINKVKKELRHLEKLNKILGTAYSDPSSPQYTSVSSTSSADDKDVGKSLEYYDESSLSIPVQLEKKYTKKRHAYYTIPESTSPPPPNRHKTKPTSTSPPPNRHKKPTSPHRTRLLQPVSSTSVTTIHVKKPSAVKKVQVSNRGPKKVAVATQVSATRVSTSESSVSTGVYDFEQKLEQLLNKFDLITDLIVLNQEDVLRQPEMLNTQLQLESSEDQCNDIVVHSRRTNKNEHNKQKPPRHEPAMKPVCYFVPFTNCQYNDRENIPDYTEYVNCDTVNLQDVFRQYNPSYIARAQQRGEILAQLKEERESRTQTKREWFRTNAAHELSSLERALPPKGPRLMSTREMKEITNKNYKRLPEVREQKLQKKAEEEKRTNRLISQVFAKRLRQGVLRGDVNVDLSKSVIRR